MIAFDTIETDVLKRLFDVVVALLVLVFAAPALLVLTAQIHRKLGSPVLFRQPRVGLNNTVFELVKFRSMNDAVNIDGQLLPDEQRLSPFGLWLRRTSLDELPTLWNVLLGHMSLVGPRPLLVQYLPLYSPDQARRHEIKPGVTGWAQVNGRNALSWERKFELDVWYVDNRSARLDLKILYLTLFKVFKHEDIHEEGGVTMSRFTGTNSDHGT